MSLHSVIASGSFPYDLAHSSPVRSGCVQSHIALSRPSPSLPSGIKVTANFALLHQ